MKPPTSGHDETTVELDLDELDNADADEPEIESEADDVTEDTTDESGRDHSEEELSVDEWLAAAGDGFTVVDHDSDGDGDAKSEASDESKLDEIESDEDNEAEAAAVPDDESTDQDADSEQDTDPESEADTVEAEQDTDVEAEQDTDEADSVEAKEAADDDSPGDQASDDEDEMSDIMAELLAAAEESERERTDVEAADAEEPTADIDRDSDDEADEDKANDDTAEDDTAAAPSADDDEPDDDTAEAEAEAEPDDDTAEAEAEADEDTAEDAAAGDAEGQAEVIEESGPESKSTEKNDASPAKELDAKSDAALGEQRTTEAKTAGGSGMVTAVPTPKDGAERSLPIGRLLVAAAVATYAVLALGSIIDGMRYRGEAMRGVSLSGLDVGGQDPDALNSSVGQLTDQLADRDLEVSIGDTTVASDPVSLGLGLDGEAMIDEALTARRGGFLPLRPLLWVGRLFGSHDVAPRYVVDAATSETAATSILGPALQAPVEPTLARQGSEVTVSPGAPGVRVDADQIVDRLVAVVDNGEPYRLELAALDAQPEIDTADVTALAEEINERTADPITVRVLDQKVELSPRTLRNWIEMEVDGSEVSWIVDEEAAIETLQPLFPELGSDDGEAKFTVVDGTPVILPTSDSVTCCAEGSGAVLAETIASDPPAPEEEDEPTAEEQEANQDDEEEEEVVEVLRTAVLAPIITGEDEGIAELEALGIIEEVSTFTTPHACCQNRVANIQRFADLTQGVVIRPDEVFSLNGHVGRRTIEKGFVADGAIVLGNFEPQVGGGISQYATTFFNAAFFAGLEFVEYQSHSIYISRYPRGREATISWQRPDLKVRNNTDYGILVWNEYTPTSITVTFYSTKHLEVEALPLRRSSDRQCRIDITPRTITYPDGSIEEDSVFALYRPGEGLDCNGDSTTPEEDEEEPPPAEQGGGDPGDGDDGEDDDSGEVLPSP